MPHHAYPIFKPVFRLFINSNLEIVSQFENGNRIHSIITGGHSESSDNHYPFNVKINSGVNWLYLNKQSQILTLDASIRAETHEGHGVYIRFKGQAKFTDSLKAVLDETANTMEYWDTEFFIKPVIETDGSTRVNWVNDKLFVGRGRYVRDEAGQLVLEFFVSMCH
ncbi:hypothetical protein V1514DRAFT_325989 [Lipomyces japonicus]|uniref:uncharacterized protein n=1 Tax=Lipomyces japonicus TaxID=56871 RepID=UPI0034CDE38F